jgi:acyl-CoA dehydrogenase
MSPSTHHPPWMTSDLHNFRAKVRDVIARELAPHLARWREQGRPDLEAWATAGRAGLLLPDVPKEYGGVGGNFAHEAVVREELLNAGIHFGSSVHSIVAHYIFDFGSETQKRTLLPRMARGELVGAIAMTEQCAGTDLQGIKTTARRDGDHYVVNGAKTFITNGAVAGILCVVVKTDPNAAGPNGMSLLLVETKDLKGYRVGRILEKLGRKEQDVCELFFDNMRVRAANLLGPAEGKGFSQLMKQLPYERLSVAVGAVATMERAVAITTKYVKERTAFGKPLLDFQNTRFKLAECKTESQIGRVFLDHCIQRFIAGQFDAVTAAMAKYWLTDCEGRIVDECLQLHGGIGYLSESPIARMWADSRAERIYAGTNDIMKEIIGWSL